MRIMNTRYVLVLLILIGLIVASVGLVILFYNSEPPIETNVAPVLEISSPVADSEISGTIDFNITILDEETLTADIYIDGDFRTSSNTYSWDTTLETEGRHTLLITAHDSGGLSDTEHFQVSINNIAEDVFTDDIFKIMTYNIKESGLNDDWKEIIKQENPDMAVLIETGLFDDASNVILNAATSELNSYFQDELPYDSYTTQNVMYSTSGEAILSRFPVKSINQLDTVPLDDDSDYYMTHDVLEAVLDINGVDVHVFCVHLKASAGTDNQQRREAEMEGLINYMDSLGDVPILYLSDQNSFSPDDTGDLAPATTMLLGYGPMTMMLYPNDTTYGEYSSEVHNFTDIFRDLNPDDPGYSFGGQEGAPYMRIDYIIANSFFDGMFLNSTVIEGTLADSASDHCAVIAWLNWSAGSEVLQKHLSSENVCYEKSEDICSSSNNAPRSFLSITVCPLLKGKE